MSIIIVAENNRVIPVIAPFSPAKGAQVCFMGGYSGLNCGIINNLDFTVARGSPWKNSQGQYPEEYFQHMVLVGMATNTRAQVDNQKFQDLGAPVFAPI